MRVQVRGSGVCGVKNAGFRAVTDTHITGIAQRGCKGLEGSGFGAKWWV